MVIIHNARIGFRALRVHALRSALTMLGIAIGVAAVIAMVAVGAGAQIRVAEEIQSLGSNLIIVLPGNTTTGGVRGGQGSQLTITEDDAMAIQRDVSTVQAAAPTSRGTMQVVHGGSNWATNVMGVTPEWFEAREWGITDGRPIAHHDHGAASKVALIGQTAAFKLFGEENPIGLTIRIRAVPFTIIGVLDRKGQNTWGQDQDDILMVPLSTAKRKLLGVSHAKSRAVQAISVKIRSGEDLSEAEAQIWALLRQRHRLQPYQDDDFVLRNLSDVLSTHENAAQVVSYLLAAIASVSLLVGGIGIMNIMLVSVTERTREIGLRMAVGARMRDILIQFLAEAVVLSLMGGVLGIAIGLGMAPAISYVAGWRTVVELDAIALAFASAAAVGIFFGFYPARKAALLDPIAALRYE
jgi:putative ABC transport system permease protein